MPKNEYNTFVKYCIEHASTVALAGSDLHSRNITEVSTRATKTRKNIKMATNAMAGFGAMDDDEDEEDDDDYDIGEDKAQLEDDERDDQEYDQLVDNHGNFTEEIKENEDDDHDMQLPDEDDIE